MKFRRQKGFTLIELLVVIAIIGLLAGIVLVSLSGAQEGARDARITAAIAQTRNLAELVANSNNGSYIGDGTATESVCDPGDDTLSQGHTIYGDDLGTVETEVSAQGGSAVSCQANASNYCVFAQMNSGQYYCVDSTGASGQTATDPNAVNLCDGTTFVCP